jgi:hypothetical protein
MASQISQPCFFSYAQSKFIFPSHFLYPNFNLPAPAHPWFNEYVVEVDSKVKYRNSRIYVRYPDCLEDLDRLSQLDREFVIEGCHTVYDNMLFRRTVMKLNARRAGKYLHSRLFLVNRVV